LRISDCGLRIQELEVSGVRDSGVRELKPKNSNMKLNTETLVIGISDCGLRISIFNPQSTFYNLQ